MKLRSLCFAGLLTALAWLAGDGPTGGASRLSKDDSAPVAAVATAEVPPPPDLHDDRLPGQFRHRDGGPTDAVSAPAPIPPAIPAWSRLVFESYRDNNWEIYSADSNGANQVRLTNNGAADLAPRLNRGCTRIAFTSKRTGNYDIWTMNLDGSGLVRLTTHGADEVNPAWSPDGTRIAYQSYRDGQAEIYVMNANGSGQTRLTQDPAYDGQPACSPDGTRIAFTSRRAAGSGIWAMNADGGNQHLLAAVRYAQDPAWSPDGAQIAFDADSDGDEWNELMLMNADGSNQRQVYDGGYAVEIWARSWSADGSLIGLTRSLWTYYQGSWYWTDSYLEAWDSGWGSQALPGTGTEWNPDWATLDSAAPFSSMTALPAQSPYQFTVSWGGSDAGPAGLRSFDVQIRDGLGGAWTNWRTEALETSGAHTGIGGHTYYFRARARDNAFNVEPWPADFDAVTTVEALSPQTKVVSLPAYIRDPILVQWDGIDRGGSGIRSYDIQVRDGSGGAWTDWQTATTVTEAEFTGTAGHVYFFRSRGVDNAGNLEAWPSGDGDASTTFYAWTLTSSVADNRGVPLAGVTLASSPSPFTIVPDSGTGTYVAYFAEETATCSASWSKPGYTSLPATSLPGSEDVHFNTVLPPGDNVVFNWGYEQALSSWTTGGEIEPTVTDTARHTGERAALLGRSSPTFKSSVNLSQDVTDSSRPQGAMDSSGTIHVVWGFDGIHYARRYPDGTWSSPQTVADVAPGAFDPQVALDVLGNLHIVWRQSPEPPEVYYLRRNADGTWSTPQNISITPNLYSWGPQLSADGDGALHVVWREFNQSTESSIRYARHGPDGVWSAPQKLSGEMGCEWPALAVEDAGIAHVVWSCVVSENREVFYARRSPAGSWSAPQNVSNNPGISIVPALAVEANGRVHITWSDYAAGRMDTLYARRSTDGTWSSAETVAEGIGGDDYVPQVAVDDTGAVHAIARGHYMVRSPAGGWSRPVALGAAPHMVVNANGTVQATWFGWPAGASEILYAQRYSDGAWSTPENLSVSPGFSQFPRLAVDGSGAAHVVWEDNSLGNMEIYYAEPLRAEAGGDSQLVQAVAIPADAVNPTLSFLYRLEGTPEDETNWFEVQLQEGSNTTTLFSTASSAGNWSHRWFDLAPWQGKTISLRFNVHQTPGRLPVWAYLDEVTMGSAYPDTWISKHGATTAPPGWQVTYIVHYGNRGGVPAPAARITDTLPAEVQFLAAEPPPNTVTPSELVWEAGDLLPASGPAVIVVKAAVRPEVAGFTLFTNAAAISAATPEIEIENNAAHVSTRVAYPLYLPVINKE